MKRFKDFIKSDNKKIHVVLAQPSHGKHAQTIDILKQKKQNIRESTLDSWVAHNENKHLGSSNEEISEKLHATAPKLTDSHKQAIAQYSMNSAINKNLVKSAKTGDSSSLEKHHPLLNKLDSALAKSKLKRDLHVYHGTKRWNPGREAKKGNGLIKLPAYTSTTHHKGIAQSFAWGDDGAEKNHILHIHLKPGDKASYIGHVSNNPDDETLLPRNTVLRVHPKPDIHGSTHIWHATVHHQD